jgi:hypothetical protein
MRTRRRRACGSVKRVEIRQAIIYHRFAIDQERRRLEAAGGFNDSREAVGPIISALSVAAHPRALTAHHQPEAVMLDFVDP